MALRVNIEVIRLLFFFCIKFSQLSILNETNEPEEFANMRADGEEQCPGHMNRDRRGIWDYREKGWNGEGTVMGQ